MKDMKYVFDLARNATEVYSYLITYMLPSNFQHDRILFLKGLETLLYEHAKITIELNTNKLIRKSDFELRKEDPYYKFSQAFNIDQIVLENVIDNMLSVKYVDDQINTAMGPDTFSIWALTPGPGYYLFESYGDYRLNEWYKDHVKNGKLIK